jgi:hypothetical protein
VSALVVCALSFVLPSHGTAQDGFGVAGRVVDSQTNAGVVNAIVTLDAQRPILTGTLGEFSFADVAAGEYTLRVEAFGYVAASRSLRIDGDASVMVELEVAPFVLDPLVVAPREIEVEGRVRDPMKDLSLPDVDVRTSRGEAVRTGGRGRFEVGAWDGVDLLLQIRAFGYLPMDSVVVPAPGARYEFNMTPDPIVERMIEVEIRRIEERAGGRRAITFRPLSRDDLLRRRGFTVMELLRTEYGDRVRLGCVVLDERALTPAMADGVLRTMLAQDIERLEFLFRGRMLRIYTREFMRTMLGSGVELTRATYVDMANPPFCT